MEHIVKSPFPPVVIPKVSVTNFVTENWDAFLHRTALVDLGTDKCYTYKELKVAIARLSSGLSCMGITKGQVVCMFSHNSADYLIFLYAVLALGAQVTLANGLSVADELFHQLKLTNAIYIYTTSEHIDRAKSASDKYGKIKTIFTSDDVPGCVSLSTVSSMGDQHSTLLEADLVQATETAVIPFSSGTTGQPKGVVLTHYNLVSSCSFIRNPAFFHHHPEQGAHVLFQPFSHVYGMLLFTSCLSIGEKIVILPRFNFEAYLKAASEYQVERLWIVPPVAVLIAKESLVQKYDFSKVKDVSSGAAPIGEDMEKEVMMKLPAGALWAQGYGMTENAGLTHYMPVGKECHGSIGVVVNNTEVKVIDPETGKSLGPGHPGELMIRGPQVMQGYLDNPKATLEMLTPDKWLHTGDMGYYTKEGYFFIVDRIKELIKYKGYQVAPAELEAILLGHPAVADVCVIGVVDQEAGELPRAYVVKKPDNNNVTSHDIEDFLAGKVAPYKKLRGGVRFVTHVPKSASGKLLRRLLRDKANQEM